MVDCLNLMNVTFVAVQVSWMVHVTVMVITLIAIMFVEVLKV